MKRMILAAALMIAASGAKAQDTDISKDEFGFSLGFGTQVMHDGNYIDMRHYVERQLGWEEGGTPHFFNIGLSLGVEYYRQISNPIALGVTAGYAQRKDKTGLSTIQLRHDNYRYLTFLNDSLIDRVDAMFGNGVHAKIKVRVGDKYMEY